MRKGLLSLLALAEGQPNRTVGTTLRGKATEWPECRFSAAATAQRRRDRGRWFRSLLKNPLSRDPKVTIGRLVFPDDVAIGDGGRSIQVPTCETGLEATVF